MAPKRKAQSTELAEELNSHKKGSRQRKTAKETTTAKAAAAPKALVLPPFR
jgi:hypothetical protein